jgi:lipopolysaccharide transport system ATP-binding protein
LKPIITVANLSKRYVVGHQSVQHERYTALRDVMVRGFQSFARKAVDLAHGREIVQGDEIEEFWALKDLNFEVKAGEVLGIIGLNGAGKTTLLKILSRITEPTAGCVTLRGRVASLLEVGTGFHPELTGRENIFLNGAILGMSRAEIRRRFDEIVAFADVDRFLDTPVKRYSSGMYVRLAFAVAAHLEPEILLVDEVLAVGDAEFQRKCLGKMEDVASKQGRTVLFVSHNMTAIETLCPRTLCLAGGVLADKGDSAGVIARYLKQRPSLLRSSPVKTWTIQKTLRISEIRLSRTEIRSGEPLEVQFRFCAETYGQLRECSMLLYSVKGIRVGIIDFREAGVLPLRYEPGEFAINVSIAALPLVEGDFTLGLYIVTDQFSGDLLDLAELNVIARRKSSKFTGYAAEARGLLNLDADVSVSSIANVQSGSLM